MKILVDTNVLMDYIAKRKPYFDNAEKIVAVCSSDKVYGAAAAHSIVNLFYLTRKELSEEERRNMLLRLCKIFDVIGVDNEKIISALNNRNFKDFEDCLQDECAYSINADYIVTRNTKDFKNSKIKAIAPNEFLELL